MMAHLAENKKTMLLGALKILRGVDIHLHDGVDDVSACRKAGILDKTYYYWRKKFGGLDRSQLSEMKILKKRKRAAE